MAEGRFIPSPAQPEPVEGPAPTPAPGPLTLSPGALATILEAASVQAPAEACGLLLGIGAQIHTAQPAANIHPTPLTRFEIDPAALLAAHRDARSGGPALVGYFHSHPTGHPRPSATDCEHASGDGRVWAIVAAEGDGWDVTFWKDGENGFEALSYSIVNA
jgi:proteasome lid subunit RPN8/RPN11